MNFPPKLPPDTVLASLFPGYSGFVSWDGMIGLRTRGSGYKLVGQFMSDATGKRESVQKRNAWWYVKWVFACNVASFILFVIAMVISLPIADDAFIVWWFESPWGSVASLAVAVAVSPFIYRRLR